MSLGRWSATLALAAGLCGPAAQAGEAARRAILPPELPWQGRSLELVAPASDPWITPAEKSGFRRDTVGKRHQVRLATAGAMEKNERIIANLFRHKETMHEG